MAAFMDSIEMDKLSYEIFSILESKFLYGHSLPSTPVKNPNSNVTDTGTGKVRILSIDDGPLAGAALSRLESSIKLHSDDPNARIADFFDIAAGSGTGGVLAAMLFTRNSDGRPLFTADQAIQYLSKNRRGISTSKKGIFRGIFRHKSDGIFRRIFGDSTLRDTLKPVLVPCYDLKTGAPFVFSRADAMETDGYDFKISGVCSATCADRAVGMRSVDGKTSIVAVGGGVAMANPTSAAITHVLNNKQEFPFANGVEDLLVVSLGNGDFDTVRCRNGSSTPSRAELVKIAGIAAADLVDQAITMAFGNGDHRTSNYVRIQANAENMLSHRNIESVLFRGKKISEQSNADKLETFAEQLIKEQQRRKSSSIPTVFIKQAAMTPRSSSATISTVTTAITSSSVDSD